MKRLIYLTLTILFNLTLYAQAPMQFNYQAVVRDGAGNALQSQNVAVTINILKGRPDGILVFFETHNTSTNELGLVNLKIGSVASMESIDWGADDYFVMVLVNGNLMGITQLLSVPYAMHAKTAESFNRIDISSALEGQILRYDGNKFVNSQQQSLSLDGSKLSISDGNTVNLPSSYLPVLTTSEILALTPQTGESVFNITQNHYQVYNGTHWVSIPANCWPQPTLADAGPSQKYFDGRTSTTLMANAPEQGHGVGRWSIVSGNGGTISDVNNPNSLFTGQINQTYKLSWTIETDCNTSTGLTQVNFEPSYYEKVYASGEAIGGIDWVEYDLELIPVYSKRHLFWRIMWLEAGKQFRFIGDLGNTFSGENGTSGFYDIRHGTISSLTTPGQSGYYMVVVNLQEQKIAIVEPKVYLIGNSINSWDTANPDGLFDIDNENRAIVLNKNLSADEIRMYAWFDAAEGWFTDWWQSEFMIFDGKIEFRGAGDDQPRVYVEAANHTIRLNFKYRSGSIVKN